MKGIDPAALAGWASGEWMRGTPPSISGLANDSRKIDHGQLFVALRTAVRDGHDFLEAAREAGASGAMVERFLPEVELPQLVVPNTGVALISAARGFRDTWNARVVGITGSCGKTTCKDVLACLLSGSATLSTEGNLNNLIGVPMSILRPSGTEADFAVLEAGISEPGEMVRLAAAIDPDWGIITAIGPAHLEDLKTVNNIALEKGRLLGGARLRGAFVGETAAPYFDEIGCPRAVVVKRDRYVSSEWAFDFESSAGATRFKQRLQGVVQEFEYAGTGAGLASNVALAIATAFSMGVPVANLRRALSGWRPSKLRNEWRQIGSRKFFVDCYNANPVSMRDSLATFVSETAESDPRLYVIGCMEELGAEATRLHEELGREFPLRKEDFLLVIGSEASSVLRGMKDAGRQTERCFEIGKAEEAGRFLDGFSGSVFLKGSRRYRLESTIDALEAKSEGEGGSAC